MRDAKDDGRKAIEILREHYVGKGKPRVIALYTELASLKMSEDCGLTDYVLKAETAATSLKSAGEEISDSLLVAMVLKGLPTQYNTFKTVVTQRDVVYRIQSGITQLRGDGEVPTTIGIGRDRPGDDSTANTADAVEQKRGSGRPDQSQ